MIHKSAVIDRDLRCYRSTWRANTKQEARSEFLSGEWGNLDWRVKHVRGWTKPSGIYKEENADLRRPCSFGSNLFFQSEWGYWESAHAATPSEIWNLSYFEEQFSDIFLLQSKHWHLQASLLTKKEDALGSNLLVNGVSASLPEHQRSITTFWIIQTPYKSCWTWHVSPLFTASRSVWASSWKWWFAGPCRWLKGDNNKASHWAEWKPGWRYR